jgi:hypothetical protein
MSVFSPTIARRSPFGGIKERGYFPNSGVNAILPTRRASCRIRCMCRTHGLLAADTKGNEGSNPSPSATQSEPQRNRAAFPQESLKIAAIP